MSRERKASSRILAMLLSLCMVIQLVPAVNPQAQAGDVSSININFIDSSITSLSDFNAYNQEKDTGKVWYFDASASTGAFDAFYKGSCVRSSAFTREKSVVVKFYAEKDGTYMLTGKGDKGGEVKVDVNGISSSVALPATGNTGFDVGLVGVDAGWNTLTVTGVTARQDMQLDGFTLKYVSAGKPFALDFLAPITSGWGDAAFNEFTAYNQDYAEKTWKFLSSESNYTPAGAGTGNTIRFNLNAANKWIAFDFEVPIEGYYIPTLGYQGSGADGMTAKLAVDGNVIGTVDTTANATNNTKTFEEGIKLTAGTHKLVVSRSSASGSYFCLRNLKFTPATEPTEIAVAEETVIDFVNYGRSHANGDKYIDAKLSNYGWALSDTSSQSVLESSNTKMYKHVASGAVSSLLGLPSEDDIAVFDFKVLASSYYTVSVDAIKGGAECEVYIDDEKIGDLASLAANGVAEIGATNIQAGEHTIGFKKTGGAATLNMYSISFTPKTYGISFESISSLAEAKLEEHTWELNEEESNSAPVEASSVYAATDCGRIFINKTGAKIAFDFEIPETGYYDITAKIEKHANGIISNVYIDGQLAGTVNNKGTGGVEEVALRRVYLEKDGAPHTMVIKKLGGATGVNAELRLYSVKINKTDKEIGIAGVKAIDFSAYAAENEDGDKYTRASIESYGWEINKEKSNNTVLANGNTRAYNAYGVARGLIGLRYYGDKFAVDFDVPGPGVYQVSTSLERAAGTITAANVYVDGQFAGILSTEGEAGLVSLNIGKVNLQGNGPHTLVLEKIGAVDGDNQRIVLEKFTFTPIEGEPLPQIISFSDASDKGVTSLTAISAEEYGWSLNLKESTVLNEEINGANAHIALENAGDQAAFDFTVDAPGYYDVLAVIEGAADKGIVGDIFVNDIKVGEVDSVNTSGTASINLEGIELSAGKHSLYIKKTAGEADGSLTLSSIAFVPGERPKTEVLSFQDIADVSDVLANATIKDYKWQVSDLTTCSYGLYQPNATALFNLRNDGEVMAFDFTVAKSGKYNVDIRNEANGEAGVIADVYVNDVKVGTVDTYGKTGLETVKLGTATLKGNGEINTVKFVRCGGGANNARLLTSNVVFTPLAAAMVDGVEPILDSSVLSVGETSTVRAAMHLTDGSYAEVDNVASVRVIDGNIAIYENGVLIAKEAGKTQIEITATINGKSYTGRKEIQVISTDEIAERHLVLVADKAFPIGIGETRDILIQGAISNIVVNMERASDYEVIGNTGESIVSTELYVDNSGSMYLSATGVKAGSANITVSVTVDGYTDEVVIPVTVAKDAGEPEAYVITFAPYGVADLSGIKYNVHGYEINKEDTSAGILENENTKFSGSSLCLQLDNQGDEAVINFDIPEDGIYDIDFAGVHTENYGIIAAFYIDGKLIGDHNFSDPDGEDSQYSELLMFNDIELTAGTHEFKAVRLNESPAFRHYRMWLSTMSFTKQAELAQAVGINVNYGKDKLVLGESEPISFSLRMSDGKDYYFPKYVSGFGGVAAQVEIPERIGYDGSIMTGNKQGLGRFKLSASIPGASDEITAYWDINVTDGQFFDFKRASEVDPLTVIISKDLWRVDTDNTAENLLIDRTFRLSDYGMVAKLNCGEEVALKLMVQEDGIYDIDVSGMQLGDLGMQAAFYLNDTYLGEFDFADASNKAGVSIDVDEATMMFNTVELKAGEHTLYIKRVNENGGAQMQLCRIVLADAVKQAALPKFAGICIQIPSGTFEYWKTMQSKVTVWMDNNRPYRIGLKRDGTVDESNRLLISSSDKEIFTVDQSGLLTGSNDKTKVGSAKLIAEAVIRGQPHSAEETVETIRVLQLLYKDTIYVDRKASESAVITAILDNGTETALIPDEGTAVTVSPYDEGRAEGFAIVEEGCTTIQVTGVRAGSTGVIVEATVDGVTGSIIVPVMVFATVEGERDIDIDFGDMNLFYSPFTAKLESFGWEINMDESSETVDGSTISLNGRLSATIFRWEDILDGRLVIDFMVYDGGYYSAELIGDQIGNYGADADIYIDDAYVGEFNFSHPSDSDNSNIRNEGIKTTLNSVYMERGVHKITLIRRNGRVGRHGQTPMQGIYFDRVDHDVEFKELLARVEKDTICVGESTSLTAQVIMSDDSVRNFGPLKDGSVDESNKLDVTVISGSEHITVSNGSVTALGAGNATISVSAVVDGVSTPVKTVDVTVTEEKLNSVEAALESDLYVGKEVVLNVYGKTDETESEINLDDLIIEVDGSASADKIEVIAPDILDPTWRVKGIAAGAAELTVKAKLGELGEAKTYTLYFDILDDGLVGINVTAMPRYIRPDSEGTQIKVSGGSWKGDKLDISGAEITYSYADAEGARYVTLDPDTGWVTPTGELGYADISVHVEMPGFADDGEIRIVVTNGKTGRSYYTEEKVANARENIEKYAWARAEMEKAVNDAEKYLDKNELLWSMVTTNELPRSASVGYMYDPSAATCRYCGVDFEKEYSNAKAWLIDVFNRPWKVQCPNCRRVFPSNDFGKFYELGIDENGGDWSYELAKKRHAEMFNYDVNEEHPNVGYLKNNLYPEMDEHIDQVTGEIVNEGIHGWGVDDGYGYKPPDGQEFFDGYANVYVKEHHSYIAFYNYDMMTATRFMLKALPSLGNAYMYTGEAKYGRAGAILLDRLADVYGDMNVDDLWPVFNCSTNSKALGKLQNPIHECGNSLEFAKAYDALYPAFDDPYVIDFLSKKAKKYNMENTKENAELIRKNCEDGILRAIFEGVKNGDIYGNFGTHQMSLATAAVVLDDYEDTKEMLTYLMASDESGWHRDGHTGGELIERLINDLDRDGGTAEGLTANYANLRCTSIASVADALQGYTRYENDPDIEAIDLYNHPIYQRMLEAQIELTMCRRTSLNAGDSGSMAALNILMPGVDSVIRGYQATESVQLAQMLYFMNGNSAKGLCADIFTKNPEQISQDVQKVIDEHGEYPFDDSILLAGYGFTALRDGSLYNQGRVDEHDNQRAFWMSFAPTGNHGHHDALNLGIFAYGLDFAPDLGYPTSGSAEDEDRYWGQNTISHNTIGVNDVRQGMKSLGEPLHYDDADIVKLVDLETPNVYSVTDEFRRTVVMVKVDDDVSYGVDFFRVKGGDEHLFSFHAQTDEEPEQYSGFTVGKKKKGSYAGETVEHRTTGITNGYSYLYNVRTAQANMVDDAEKALAGNIWMDFHIKDFRNAIKDNKNLYLRMTMLNDFNLSEISFATGDMPKRGNNPDSLGYVLARRSGENLDSTFTTVYEPYKNERYLNEVKRITDIVRSDGKAIDDKGDVVQAVKAEHVNGRVDYILYATNNIAEYVITDTEENVKIKFNGFVGMCSIVDGKVTYNYINDGTKLEIKLAGDGDVAALLELEQNEYTGEVVDFTRTIEFENSIEVRFDELDKVDVEAIAGRHIYIENDGIGNGVYLIEGAVKNEDDTVTLDIGDRILVRSAESENGKITGFKYNIASGQYFSIPLSAGEDKRPVFTVSKDMAATAGKKFSHTVFASSELGEVTYFAAALPRGASLNAQTGEISWTPDSTQVGEHHFAIEASAGAMSSTQHFIVEVFKAAGSVTSAETGADAGNGGGGNSGGGSDGGASGGGSSSGGDTSTDTGSIDDTTGDNTDDNTDVGNGVLDIPSEKFIDLGNHAWAKDAVYSLVDAGVVNGTSRNTYSPANNIKRADFAIMLVRAFGITGGEGENFADIDVSKYYAEELRLAKANDIVNGVGENRFNPEGEITRQDMMLMLARALDAVDYKLSEADQNVLSQFSDAAQISDYARDAISRVVKDGIIAGSNGRINPLAKATRAEVAVMLDRVLNEK